MGAQIRAGVRDGVRAVGLGIDCDEGDEYDYGNESKEEARCASQVMGGEDNVCSNTDEIHRYTDTKLYHGISRLHPTRLRPRNFVDGDAIVGDKSDISTGESRYWW